MDYPSDPAHSDHDSDCSPTGRRRPRSSRNFGGAAAHADYSTVQGAPTPNGSRHTLHMEHACQSPEQAWGGANSAGGGSEGGGTREGGRWSRRLGRGKRSIYRSAEQRSPSPAPRGPGVDILGMNNDEDSTQTFATCVRECPVHQVDLAMMGTTWELRVLFDHFLVSNEMTHASVAYNFHNACRALQSRTSALFESRMKKGQKGSIGKLQKLVLVPALVQVQHLN